MSILRFLLVAVVVIVLSALALGYLAGQRTRVAPQRADTSDTVARARESGAEIGEKAGAAAARVQETVNEAALSTKIKAKMALDDLVKARDINVTTHGTTVTLSGVVDSKTERDRAMALAKETDGVTQVIDDLHAR
ncbi:MAG TPA: BON domain-containing protein [Vicinamibacterales bacterium]|jgi:osmotically-inducible protein OsmY